MKDSYLCPADRIPLVMSERQGVEIDYCPACRGVWLDRGELDKIIERSAAQPEPAPHPQYAQQSQRGDQWAYGRKPHKRRKSFLEELFD